MKQDVWMLSHSFVFIFCFLHWVQDAEHSLTLTVWSRKFLKSQKKVTFAFLSFLLWIRKVFVVQKLALQSSRTCRASSSAACCWGVFDLIAAKQPCCGSIFIVQLTGGEEVLKGSLSHDEFTHESFLSHAFNLTDSLHKHMVVRNPVA